MKEKGIEEIFKSALNNFETDVDPSVWTNVQQAINAPTATPGNDANSSVAGKAGAVAGKLGVKAIVAIVAVVTGVSVGTYFLLSDKESEKAVVPTEQVRQPATPAVTEQQAPPKNESVTSTPATVNATQTNSTAAKQKSIVKEKQTASAAPTNAEPQASVAQPPKVVTTSNPPVAVPPAAPKPQPPVNTTPPPAAPKEIAKPSAEDHTYQNGFEDINDYVIPDADTEKIKLPNVFTPNGDGKNDEFKINTKNLKSLTVQVFNQSGKMVYQWSGLEGKWDGNLADGRPAPAGKYFYSVLGETLDGHPCIANSPLTLTRQIN